jgi:hypothetical protein
MDEAPVGQLGNLSGCDLWKMRSFLCGNQRISIAIGDDPLPPGPARRSGWWSTPYLSAASSPVMTVHDLQMLVVLLLPAMLLSVLLLGTFAAGG